MSPSNPATALTQRLQSEGDALEARVGGCLGASIVLIAVFYVRTSWDKPHRSAFVATLVGGLVVALLARHWLSRDPRRAALLGPAWNVLLIGLIVALSALDGGVESPIPALLFVPVAIAALAYPARQAMAVAGSGVVGFAILSIAGGGIGNGRAAIVGIALLATAAIGILQAHREGRRRDQIAREHAAVELSEERLRGGFEHSPVGMAIVGVDGRFEQVNDALCRLLDRDAEWLRGRSPTDVTHPDDRGSFEEVFERLASGEIDCLQHEKRYLRADGERVTVLLGVSAIREESGDVVAVHAQFVDISAEHGATERAHTRALQQAAVAQIGQRALRGAPLDDLLDDAVEAMRETLPAEFCSVTEFTGDDIGVVRAAYGERIGTELPLRSGKTLIGYVRDSGEPALMHDARTETRFDPVQARKKGYLSGMAVEISGLDGAFGGLVALSRDPGAFAEEDLSFLRALANVLSGALSREAADDRLRYISLHDDLTGLPNRTLLLDRLGHALERAERTGETIAVLFLDVDNFKTINDAYGHAIGDDLLKALPARLLWPLRAGDTLARFGGDEFVVLSEGLADPAEAHVLAERLLASLEGPFSLEIEGRVTEHHLQASVGLAIAGPEHAGDPGALIRDADIAMYRAKQKGGAVEIFDMTSRARVVERVKMTGELPRAIDEEELYIVYQPIVDLRDGSVGRVEALLRWRHPEHGSIAPSQFIELAEESGLILPIGSWVIDSVVEQLGRWDRGPIEAMRGLRVGVNVSARQLVEPSLVGVVMRALERHGVTSDRFLCEITETALIEDPLRASEIVDELISAGVLVSLDDFGTGYSALEHLKQFPLSVIKLDRTFIADVATNPIDTAVVSGLIEIARAMDIMIVAEGIETPAQLGRLRALGCDLAQGFLFSGPLSPAGLAAFMASLPDATCDLDSLQGGEPTVLRVARARVG